MTYNPYICRDENDDDDRAKPRITDNQVDMERHTWCRKIFQRSTDNNARNRHSNGIEEPHLVEALLTTPKEDVAFANSLSVNAHFPNAGNQGQKKLTNSTPMLL